MTPRAFAVREIRHRPLFAALFVLSSALGTALLAGLAAFERAVEAGVKDQARELWAADITVQGAPAVLDDTARWARGRWPGAAQARSVDTLSMVQGRDLLRSVSLSGVTPGYPLYGEIRTGSGRPLAERLGQGLVAAPKLLADLGLRLGDRVRLGARVFVIVDTLASRTDTPNSFFELAPTALLSLDDLRSTRLLGPGSRAQNVLYLNLPAGENLEAALGELKARLDGAAEANSWSADNPGVLRFIKNTLVNLNFLALFTLVLGGIGVASALQSAFAASLRSLGMVLALGAPRGFLIKVWAWWVGLLTAAGLFVALGVGQGVAWTLARLFGDLLPGGVPPSLPGGAVLRSLAVSGAVSALFTALPLSRLADLSPHMILAWEIPSLLPRPRRTAAFLALGAPVFYGVLWAQLGRPWLALQYGAALAGLVAGAALLVNLLLTGLRRLLRSGRGLHRRLAARGLARAGSFQTAAAVSLALSFAALLALFLVQKNLVAQFVESFPETLPNTFFINLQPGQRDRFAELLGRKIPLFPLVRGRVTRVNGVPARDLTARAQHRRGAGDGLTREFGLTFGDTLPPTDAVVQGGGLWNPRVTGPQVSVFEGYKKRFGITVGDRIEFSVLGRRVTATVSSLRSINQSVRQPFFYFLFNPGALGDAPHTYMGGAHLSAAELSRVERALLAEMPNATVIDLAQVAAVTGRVLRRLTRVVRALGLFTLAAGLLLLTSSLLAGLADRRREAVLYHALGASRPQVAKQFFIEYLLRGAVSAGAALGVGLTAAWVLVARVLELPFLADAPRVAAGLGGAVLALALLSLGLSLQALRTPPMEALRYE